MLKHIRKRFSGDRAKKSEAVHFTFNARLKCGLWHVDFGMWTLACGLWHVDFGMWTLACGLCRKQHKAVFCNLN